MLGFVQISILFFSKLVLTWGRFQIMTKRHEIKIAIDDADAAPGGGEGGGMGGPGGGQGGPGGMSWPSSG